jgi:hypothetical protein
MDAAAEEPMEPAAAALGNLMFGQGSQETCGPAFLVGLGASEA